MVSLAGLPAAYRTRLDSQKAKMILVTTAARLHQGVGARDQPEDAARTVNRWVGHLAAYRSSKGRVRRGGDSKGAPGARRRATRGRGALLRTGPGSERWSHKSRSSGGDPELRVNRLFDVQDVAGIRRSEL